MSTALSVNLQLRRRVSQGHSYRGNLWPNSANKSEYRLTQRANNLRRCLRKREPIDKRHSSLGFYNEVHNGGKVDLPKVVALENGTE